MYICINHQENTTKDEKNFFVIGGYITPDAYQVVDIYKKVERIIKKEKGLAIDTELKVEDCEEINQKFVLNSLLKTERILPFCVYYDVTKMRKNNLYLLRSRQDRFLFLLTHTLKIILEQEYSEEYQYINLEQEVILELNQEEVTTFSQEQIKNYLNHHNQIFKTTKKLSAVSCLDSKSSFTIRAAKFFCHYFWSELVHQEANQSLKESLESTIKHAKILNYPTNFLVNGREPKPDHNQTKRTLEDYSPFDIGDVIELIFAIIFF